MYDVNEPRGARDDPPPVWSHHWLYMWYGYSSMYIVYIFDAMYTYICRVHQITRFSRKKKKKNSKHIRLRKYAALHIFIKTSTLVMPCCSMRVSMSSSERIRADVTFPVTFAPYTHILHVHTLVCRGFVIKSLLHTWIQWTMYVNEFKVMRA